MTLVDLNCIARNPQNCNGWSWKTLLYRRYMMFRNPTFARKYMRRLPWSK